MVIYQTGYSKKSSKRSNLDALTRLLAQVVSLTNIVKTMTIVLATAKKVAKVSCIYFGEGHLFDNCLGNSTSVNYVGNYYRQNYLYPSTYNPGWR